MEAGKHGEGLANAGRFILAKVQVCRGKWREDFILSGSHIIGYLLSAFSVPGIVLSMGMQL